MKKENYLEMNFNRIRKRKASNNKLIYIFIVVLFIVLGVLYYFDDIVKALSN